MKAFFLFIVLVCIPFTEAFADSREYLCKSKTASGFVYSGAADAWSGVTFEANATYMVRAAKDEDFETKLGKHYKGATHVVSALRSGEPLPPKLFCTTYNAQGFMDCEGEAETLRFNNQSMRFLNIYNAGYVLSGHAMQFRQDGVEVPMMVIGTCKLL